MSNGYELRKVKPFERVYELVSLQANHSHLEKLMKNKKDREPLAMMLKQIQHIEQYGIQKSCSTGKLRCLESSCNLYEIKGYYGVRREMCCVAVDNVVILLFDFKGHQGQSGKIPANILSKAKQLAKIASKLADELRNEQ